MKKIFFLLLFCVSFLSAEINEYVSDVYFANGINTKKEDADESIRIISKKFKLPNPQSYKSVANWQVSYNTTHGIGIDLYESMLQKIYEDEVGKSFVPFIWNWDEIIGLLKVDFKTLVGKAARKTDSIPSIKQYGQVLAKKLAKKVFESRNKKFTQEQIELMFKHVFDDLIDKAVDSYVSKTEEEIIAQESEDVVKQKRSYIQSIIDGHGVIIVAHSQGNLFTNRVYNDFTDKGFKRAWMKQYISAIAVASPANNILGKKSPSMTFDNDMIWLVPDSLSANVTNPKRYYFTNAVNEKIETIVSVEAHSFLTSYMATDITRGKILSFINEKVNEQKDLTKRPSQWLPKPKNCLCKEKYAKMTHVYDPDGMNSLLVNEKVKDFREDADGKIYRVDVGDHMAYVRAGFGGVIIEEIDEEEACYVLKDDVSAELGTIKGLNEKPNPQNGAVTVKLTWDNPSLD